MDVVRFAGVELEGGATGAGEPVVLLHARPFVDWYDPLVPLLAGMAVWRSRRQVDPGRAAPFGIDDDAAAIEQWLAHVGVERPHLVGHSYGGLLALELARRGHVAVRSLALLEPAGRGFLPPAEAAAGLAPLHAVARDQGPDTAMRRFLAMVGGDDGAAALDAAVPSGVATACTHAGHFFDVELPAVAAWEYGPEDARRIEVPVLLVVGTASAVGFIETIDLLQSWIPRARRVEIPGATHLLMAGHPAAVADALATFWRAT